MACYKCWLLTYVLAPVVINYKSMPMTDYHWCKQDFLSRPALFMHHQMFQRINVIR